MSAAIVAVTATTTLVDGRSRVRLNEAYVAAIRDAGMVPLVLPPAGDDQIAAVLDTVQGLVLTGGEDVEPSRYGAAPAAETGEAHAARDASELAATVLAHERRVPTLAICRGMQVVNVALGGTLVQDIPTECPSALEHDQPQRRTERVHDVRIVGGSLLSRFIDRPQIAVNSSHHQSLARVAAGLRVAATAGDGVVEAADWVADDWWMLAVQWHPEELARTAEPWDRDLFGAFAAQASKTRASRG